ncbi:helicase-related protein [Aristophania vespae]|uniref:helicase-related protein n=1 Tax=Aristophania vespae TaxID=2697033 RepID=UPI0023512427|nr:helicase-related protein [Aristophania vespae]UMM64558.1 hypothetical protein DM15PD_15740 [Aristophania vespae]
MHDYTPSPAEHALSLAEKGLGTDLKITPKERPALLRQVARRLGTDKDTISVPELIQALCQVRRRQWANNLMNSAQRAGDIWVSKSDVLSAAERVNDPLITGETLSELLESVLEERWRDIGDNPKQVLEEVRADLIDSGAFPSAKQLERLSQSIARAFGAVDLGFEDELILSEEKRQQEQEAIRLRAEKRRQQELIHLQKWEETLIGYEEIPSLLHCSRREVLKWIAENRLPIAKRETQPDGLEIFFFDPTEIKKLRPEVSLWRKGLSKKDKSNKIILNETGTGNEAIARVAALDRFAGHFRTARALKRRITLVTGPTNSGKSYTALAALAEAKSGIALAPLRLLAHEFREAMLSRNVPISLTTGEERIIDPTARHLAATVEMCPFHNPVDVAIIDEAQMLTDTDRGAAWTAAIMGVPARHIFILGAADCIPLVKRIAALCNDPVDEIHLERKSPLRTGGTLSLDNLRQGDALIAFSRREVLDYRAQLLERNKRVAVIYGALSPEVRRAEAARFNNGEADILIATDAIGMGLNLSIKRVIFSTLRKYDGRNTRNLTSQEVKQIGGRAGRFGKHEDGLVCVLEGGGSPSFIRHMLEAPPETMKDLRPFVQPDADIVQAVAQEIGSDSLYGVLTRIKRAVLRPDDPNYRLADMEQALEIAASLEGVENLDLITRWTYAMCPVDMRDNGIQRLIDWAANHASGKIVHPPGTGRLPVPTKADNTELERAEKRHKRLVSWRWLAMRFPDYYPALEDAEYNATKLNDWIESVLRTQSRMKESSRRLKRHGAPKSFKSRKVKDQSKDSGPTSKNKKGAEKKKKPSGKSRS